MMMMMMMMMIVIIGSFAAALIGATFRVFKLEVLMEQIMNSKSTVNKSVLKSEYAWRTKERKSMVT